MQCKHLLDSTHTNFCSSVSRGVEPTMVAFVYFVARCNQFRMSVILLACISLLPCQLPSPPHLKKVLCFYKVLYMQGYSQSWQLHLLHVPVLVTHRQPNQSLLNAMHAGVQPTMVVASASCSSPGHAQAADSVQEVEQMCRQIRQCVGHCDLQASTSGTGDADNTEDASYYLQVHAV